MDIVSVALQRYSAKAFDPSKKLTAEEADKVKHYYCTAPQREFPAVALYCRRKRAKARVTKSAAGKLHVQRTQMLDASHVVVFCAKTRWTTRLQRVVDQEGADGRFASEAKAANDKVAAFSPICTASR